MHWFPLSSCSCPSKPLTATRALVFQTICIRLARSMTRLVTKKRHCNASRSASKSGRKILAMTIWTFLRHAVTLILCAGGYDTKQSQFVLSIIGIRHTDHSQMHHQTCFYQTPFLLWLCQLLIVKPKLIFDVLGE